jgi:Family of unknown function (DUF5685)
LFFAHGVRLVGRADLQPAMRELGREFGRLIYLLDAFEDYERDARRGEFNAIRAAWALRTDQSSSCWRNCSCDLCDGCCEGAVNVAAIGVVMGCNGCSCDCGH